MCPSYFSMPFFLSLNVTFDGFAKHISDILPNFVMTNDDKNVKKA